MAVTEQSYTGNGSTTNYSFTFPYLKSTDITVQVDAAVTTAWSLANATTVQFNSAPANGAAIKILRDTNVDNLTATFYAGSAIKSEDLNDNFTQNLYVTQEVGNRSFENTGTSTMIGNLQMGEDTKIVFEGATDNAYETTLTVADPTADRTITLPNVTGTVVTTGDTGTVTSTMLADGTVDTVDLKTDAVTTPKITDANVTTNKIADANITTAKIADDAITDAKIADSAVKTANILAANVTTAKIADANVTTAKIADANVTTAKIADSAVTSAKIADSTIVAGDIADNTITAGKMAPSSITETALNASAVTTAKIADNAITTAKIVDDAITTAKIAADAVTATEIADNSIGNGAMADNAINTAELVDSAVTTAKINADAIDSTKIADNAIGTEHIADAELTTLAGMQSGTASVLADSTALAATTTEINSVCENRAGETTITDDDAKIPTSGAVVDYVAAQIAPIGGLEVIANKDSFPETQPAAGVVISIADAVGIVVNGSGTSTTPDTITSDATVTINNINSSFHSATVAAGVGWLVTSTGSGQIYNYHKANIKESDVVQLSDDINDFNSRYRVNAGEPSSNNDEGDLCYDTNADKMKVYDSTTSAWKEVTSTGDFKYLFLCPAGGTGAPTINGSIATYDLREGSNSGSAASVTNAAQLVVSVNGVVQKANTGTSAPAEGFAIVDANTIIFSSNLPSGASVFIHQAGSAVSIPTPGDDTVSTAKIQNLAVTTGKIADQAVDLTKLPHGDGSSNGKFLRSNNGADPTWETVSTTPEGTAILSTGESGGTKFLREDGDGTSSWQAVIGAVADGCIYENSQTISNNYTIASGKGAHSVGPLTVNATVTVNGVWVIS